MDSDRRRQISQIHQAALERPPAERLAFLEHVCADDAELRSEVALLLNGPAASGIATANRPLHAAPGSGPHLQPGAMLGAYRIERQLGAGGMGAVFLAVDTTLHRRVALKVLTSSAGDESARSRLLREARNAAALNHPDICTIHEVGDAGGIAFIAMEYVEGESLRERIGRGPMPIDAVLRIGRAVADALGYAHDNGVVHRDLKAANVIVLPSDRVKIVDFGLARRGDALIAEATTMASLVPEGAMAGTPYAMAPEQIRGETADARSDVWALGVLLWEMVNGAPPFVASTVPELFAKILTLDRLEWPAKAPIALRAVVERCLRKNPADRFPNGRDAHRAIEGVRSGPASLWSAWRYRLRRRRWTAATAALIVLALGAGVVFRGAIDRLAGIFRGQTIRLAVLPFENLTGDPAQQYLSDGLTDELITQLARLHPARLQVIAKTSSMQLRNRGATLDEIGRQLHVDYVLEGSARRDRDRVRISAMLVQVSDQAQKWSGSFERELSGILSLESDVAFGVARSLALSLLPVEQARLAGPPAVNPEAYEAYLKGLVLQSTLDADNVDAAQQYFETAIAKDPTYALAYAGLAGVWIGRRQINPAIRVEATRRLRAAIDKALELDDTLVEAHFRRAEQLAWTDWNWADADREFQRAVELNPNHAPSRSLYGDYLAITKRAAESIAQSRRALELDPLNPQVRVFYARALMFARRYDDALVEYKNVLAATPDQQVAIGNIRELLHDMRRYDEALDADRVWARTAVRGGPEMLEALETGNREGGYREAMRRAATLQASRGGRAAFNIAQFYMRAGDDGRAMEWLERAADAHDPGLPYLNVAGIWDAVRGTDRAQNVLRRMNLVK